MTFHFVLLAVSLIAAISPKDATAQSPNLFCNGDLDLRDPKILVDGHQRLMIMAAELSPTLSDPKLVAFTSSDGAPEPIAIERQPKEFKSNETSILVRSDGSLLAINRVESLDGGLANKAYLSSSSNPGDPYMSWTRQVIAGLNSHGPKLLEIVVGDKRIILLGSREFNSIFSQKTTLGEITMGSNPRYRELLQLNETNSTYDQGYAGMHWDGSHLWMSHYESQPSGNSVFYGSRVYVSKIKLSWLNGKLAATLVSKQAIWSGESRHGAFTSIVKFKGSFWLVFREGPAHESFRQNCSPGAGKIVIYKSLDGSKWSRVHELSSSIRPALDWHAASFPLF